MKSAWTLPLLVMVGIAGHANAETWTIHSELMASRSSKRDIFVGISRQVYGVITVEAPKVLENDLLKPHALGTHPNADHVNCSLASTVRDSDANGRLCGSPGSRFAGSTYFLYALATATLTRLPQDCNFAERVDCAGGSCLRTAFQCHCSGHGLSPHIKILFNLPELPTFTRRVQQTPIRVCSAVDRSCEAW